MSKCLDHKATFSGHAQTFPPGERLFLKDVYHRLRGYRAQKEQLEQHMLGFAAYAFLNV